MVLRDDEDDFPSPSSQESLTRADKGKADRKERQAREKKGLSSLKRELLKQRVNDPHKQNTDPLLKEERQNLTAEDADADTQAALPSTWATKSSQEAEKMIEHADALPVNPDTQQEIDARLKAIQKQAGVERQRDAE